MNTQSKLRAIIQEEVKRQLLEMESDDAEASGDESKIKSTKTVQLFLDRLKKAPAMSMLDRINTDIQRAQVILKFAEMVGVPENKLQIVLSTIKKTVKGDL